MAIYGMNQEGVDALKQLAEDMSKFNNDIHYCGEKLLTKINNLGEGFGIYEEQLLGLVASINKTQENGQEYVEILIANVKKLANDIEKNLPRKI